MGQARSPAFACTAAQFPGHARAWTRRQNKYWAAAWTRLSRPLWPSWISREACRTSRPRLVCGVGLQIRFRCAEVALQLTLPAVTPSGLFDWSADNARFERLVGVQK